MTATPAIVWDPSYEIDLGPHVFVTAKYRLTKERLIAEEVVTEEHFVAPHPASLDDLARVHTAEYLDKIQRDSFSTAERAQLEVPFSAEGRTAMILSCGGTLLAARLALDQGMAGHLGGGFHHAFAGHGEGFCLLNDVAVAARTLVGEGVVQHVSVVDLDVHHGNGTAAIFAGDDSVSTLSMHHQNNYPAVKPPSDLDIALSDHMGDDEYLELLASHLPRFFDHHQPELVFYLAGADPYIEDQLGGLGLSLDGLRTRDRFVFRTAADRGIPLVVVLAGGYAMDLEDTVAIHTATIEELVVAASR